MLLSNDDTTNAPNAQIHLTGMSGWKIDRCIENAARQKEKARGRRAFWKGFRQGIIRAHIGMAIGLAAFGGYTLVKLLLAR